VPVVRSSAPSIHSDADAAGATTQLSLGVRWLTQERLRHLRL